MELGYVYSSVPDSSDSAKTSLGKRNIIIASAIGVLAFFFYKNVLDHFYYGDPFWYQTYYDSLVGRDVVTALISQRAYLGSSELIYPVIAWFGSNAGIERNLLMAVFDGLMYAALFSALRLYRCNYVFIALCMMNFYVVVLATSAERLKFSYICMFIALMTTGRVKFVWLALTPLAHFQSLITEGSILVWHFFASLSMRIKVAIGAVSVVCIGIVLYFFYAPLIAKFSSYQGGGSLVESISGLALLGVAMAIFKNRFRAFLAIMPLVILTFILGSERMNMVTVTVFLYICIREGATKNPLVLLIMSYFAAKSFMFVNDIFLFGNGFATG